MENKKLKPESNENKEKLVIDGNAFYEIDLECVRNRKRQQNRQNHMKKNVSGMRKQGMKTK